MSVTISDSANASFDNPREFIENRKKSMESDAKQANDVHIQAESDHVNVDIKLAESWDAPESESGDASESDSGDAPESESWDAPESGSTQGYDCADIQDGNSSTVSEDPAHVPLCADMDNAEFDGKPQEATDSSKPSSASPSGSKAGNHVDTCKDKLPPDVPAVFDLEAGGTGKTPLTLVKEEAKTGMPAILLGDQAWQETRAGLDGKDAAASAGRGKPGAGGDLVLNASVPTATVDPGSRESDSGIPRIDPNTNQVYVTNGEAGAGRIRGRPAPAGKNRRCGVDCRIDDEGLPGPSQQTELHLVRHGWVTSFVVWPPRRPRFRRFRGVARKGRGRL